MVNSLEQDIVALYNRDLTASLSINEIARSLKKTYPYIYKKVNSLIQKEILKRTVIGRSHVCTINLQSELAILLLSINEVQKKQDLKKTSKEFRFIADILENEADNIITAVRIRQKIILVTSKPKHINIPQAVFMDKRTFLAYLVEEDMADHAILYSCEQFFNCIKELEPKLRTKRLRQR